MSQVHDNVIKSYTVDFENATLIINTKYQDRKISENTDVIFTEYLTHVFDNEIRGSIIFDIEESSYKLFLESEQVLKEQKNYGWPIAYKSEKELVDFLESNKYKAYEICSSYGLNGWVLAKQMDVVEA